MKNRVISVFFEVINSSPTSMCYITVFTCAHQVRKYAYWMQQNVFNRFHVLISIVRDIYSGVFKGRQARHLPRGPPLQL